MMNRKSIFAVILSSLFFFSVSATAHYQNNNHQYRHYGYNNENVSSTVRDFNDKRYELNQLYAQGVSDDNEKVKSLINELDTLSTQINKERGNYGHRAYNNNHRNSGGHGCWY